MGDNPEKLDEYEYAEGGIRKKQSTPAGSMQGGTDEEMHARYPKGSAMPTQAKEGSKFGRAMSVWRMNNPAGSASAPIPPRKKDDQTAQQKAASKP